MKPDPAYLATLTQNTQKYIADLEEREEAMRKACKMFVDHYPSGINPDLDQAYRLAREALAKGTDHAE